MTIVAVFNQKGGVGKTTTALNLVAALARRERQPVGIDLDPQAQFGAILGISARTCDDSIFSLFQRNRPLFETIQQSASGISIIPSHAELSKVDAIYGKGYNAINKLNISLQAERQRSAACANTPWIIDCCPMVGVLSLNAIFASDGLIIPISADHLSFKGAIQIRKTLHALEQVLKRRVNRRYLLTRFDARRRMARDVLLMAKNEFGADVCRTLISENVSLAESPALNKTIFEHAPNSSGAQNYDALLDELLADGFIES
ncbi:MAG: ParA family protein [Gallionella sp.]|jgi:chromosome partitioning protein